MIASACAARPDATSTGVRPRSRRVAYGESHGSRARGVRAGAERHAVPLVVGLRGDDGVPRPRRRVAPHGSRRGVDADCNLAIWAVFLIDYAVRLMLAGDRRRFVRSNIPDLIAILPLDFLRVARLARLARITRLLRAGSVLWRVTTDVRGVLASNGLGFVLVVTAVVILAGGSAAAIAEDDLVTFGDGLWWALVTATTVGYGDISPATPQGRAVAAVLMLVGIGTIGMLTGSIATYFLHHRVEPRANPQVEWLRSQLENWDAFDPDERRRLAAMLNALAELDDRDESAGPSPQPQV